MHTKGTIEVPELVLKHFKIDKTILYLNSKSTFVLETAPEGFTRSNSFFFVVVVFYIRLMGLLGILCKISV